MTDQSLVDETRPESWDELQGNNTAAKAIKTWAENWEPGSKPILLHGPPGVGKTSVANILVNTQDWVLHEVNASDARRTDDIKEITSTLKSSPYENRKLCLLDEVDSIPGSTNISPLVRALKNSKNPILLTANDKYEIPGKIKRACTTHKFSLGKRSRRAKLKEIIKKENIDISTRDIGRLTERPDLRSSINDLQRFAESDKDSIPEDGREWKQGEFDLVGEALKGDQISLNNLNTREVQDFLIWLDENWRNNLSDLDKQLRGIEVAVAYDCFSRADTFIGRARSEDYRYLKYASALMEIAGETRLTEPYNKNWIDKSFPSWFRQKQRRFDDGTAEDELYQALSQTERGTFGIGGNYTYFRKILLPIMKGLDKETRMEICLSARVDDKALDALNISKSEYEEFRGEGNWEESTKTHANSGMDW